MISRKPTTRGRKTVPFRLDQLPEPAYHIVTQTAVLSQGAGRQHAVKKQGTTAAAEAVAGINCYGTAPYSRRSWRCNDTQLFKVDSVVQVPSEPYI